MADALLEIRGVKKEFGGVQALAAVDLEVTRGEFICLLGPSGCGKSTLLNIVAGFLPPSAGEVAMAGKRVTAPGPERAMVFQEYALFPWMTVAENVAFGLSIRGDTQTEIKPIVERWLSRLKLKDFAGRWPRELSGGMKQRVALARALALDAPVLLMDEPFGALDALTRRSMQDELLRLWADDRRTVLFVTHGIDEAIALADRVVVMTYRPGSIKRICEVKLPRPRDPSAPEFIALQRELTGLVMEEQQRHQSEELSGLNVE